MIDQIANQPEVGYWQDAAELAADIVEHDVPRLDWFECPIMSRGDMLAVIERQKDLDGRAVNLFRNALVREPLSDLFRHYVGPHLYHPGSHYIYTTPDPSRFRFKDWRPEVTAAAIEHCSINVCGLFSNTLSWIDETGLSPSQRTYNAGFAVYTVESDSDSLHHQLRVVYSGRLKRIDAELRRFRDYRGYEVVYSGGKSLHFHFCFDLRHLKRDLAVSNNSSYQDNWTRDLPDCLLRPAYAVSWDRLAAMFCEIAEIEPDSRLRSWEQLRRCPWAFRLLDGGGHPLGMPPGNLVRQPVLASDIFLNAKRGATEWFHDPDKLGELCRHEHVRRRKTFIERDFVVTSRETELFARHAPAIFRQIIENEYPKFAGFEATETGFSNATSTTAPAIPIRRHSATEIEVGFCCKVAMVWALTGFRSVQRRTKSLIGSYRSTPRSGVGHQSRSTLTIVVRAISPRTIASCDGARRQCMIGLRWPGSSTRILSK